MLVSEGESLTVEGTALVGRLPGGAHSPPAKPQASRFTSPAPESPRTPHDASSGTRRGASPPKNVQVRGEILLTHGAPCVKRASHPKAHASEARCPCSSRSPIEPLLLTVPETQQRRRVHPQRVRPPTLGKCGVQGLLASTTTTLGYQVGMLRPPQQG